MTLHMGSIMAGFAKLTAELSFSQSTLQALAKHPTLGKMTNQLQLS